jgi:hypothetical protein
MKWIMYLTAIIVSVAIFSGTLIAVGSPDNTERQWLMAFSVLLVTFFSAGFAIVGMIFQLVIQRPGDTGRSAKMAPWENRYDKHNRIDHQGSDQNRPSLPQSEFGKHVIRRKSGAETEDRH